MKLAVIVLTLMTQTAAFAYLTPPYQTLARPIAPTMVPLGRGASLYPSPTYNLGLNTNIAPLVNPSLIPGMNNTFLPPGLNSMPQPVPTFTSLTTPLYYPSYSFPSYNFQSYNPYASVFPNSGASYFPGYTSMSTPYSYSSFPNYSLNNYGLNSFPTITPSYFPSYNTSAPSTLRLGSASSLSDRYGVNDRVPIRTASTQESYDDGGGRQEVVATSAPTSDYSGGDRIALASGTGETPASYRTVVTTPSTGAHAPRVVTKPVGRRVTPATQEERRAQTAPIWQPFIRRFKACAPNCEPTGYHTWGHRDNLSCHPQGLAVDVAGMYCSDDRRHYSALDRWDRFQVMVECMKTQMRFYRVHPNGHKEVVVGVIYRQHRGRGRTLDHHDHVHMSLGCHDGWVH